MFKTPPHLIHPSGALSVWLTRPAGMVVQATQETVMTVELARYISQDAYGMLARVLGHQERAYFVYDLRKMARYETEARTILTHWAMSVRDKVERIAVLPPPEMQKIARMGIQTVATMLSVAGIKMDVVDELYSFIREHGLRPMA